MTDHKAEALKIEWAPAEPSRDQVVTILKEGGAWSVAMLADQVGIGRQTVGSIARTLLADGLVEQGMARTPGSRTKVPVYRWKGRK